MPEDNSGPQIDAEKLLSKHDRWSAEEKDASSNAGERRQQIGALAETMQVENKALSQFRAGLKIKNEGKRMDWLRSMEELLPIARNRIMGNQPEMEFDAPEPENELGDDQEGFDADTDNVVGFGDDEAVAAE